MKALSLAQYDLEFECLGSPFSSSRDTDTVTLRTEFHIQILHAFSSSELFYLIGKHYGNYIVVFKRGRNTAMQVAYFGSIIEATNHVRTFIPVSKETDKAFRKLVETENARRF